MSEVQAPKSVPDLLKLIAKYGKRSILVSGVGASVANAPAGKVVIDVSRIEPLNEIGVKHDKITIGTGMNLGRLARDGSGINGLLRMAARLIAIPLVGNKIILLQTHNPH